MNSRIYWEAQTLLLQQGKGLASLEQEILIYVMQVRCLYSLVHVV